MYEMKCPKCDGTIECYDTYYYSVEGNNFITHCRGYCVNCSTKYQWKKVYELTSQEDLTEVSSN